MLKIAEKITTDVLVIGGGGAACTAAVAASRLGAKVTMVCKGKAGNSGNTIMIGGSYGMDGESAYYDYKIKDADPTFTKEELFRSIVNDGFNIGDQNMVEQFVEESPRIVYEVKKWGEEIGEKFRFYSPSNWDVAGRSMGRALMNGVKKTDGITIYDDTAAIDLIKTGGRVVGALALDIYSGRLLRFESKAVVIATGGFQPYSQKDTNSDMTGDGQAMAYRAGAALADMEFLLFLMAALEPNDMRGSILPAICTFRQAFDYDPTDRFGNKIEVPAKLRDMETTSEMCKLVHMLYYGKAINEGRGTEQGGFYFDFSRFSDDEIDKMFDAVIEHFDGFYRPGYYHGESIIEYRELAKKNRRLEVGLFCEYCVGGIFVDENMETGIPGLYAAGEAASGVFGANRVADAVTEMIAQGYRAGESSARFAADTDFCGVPDEAADTIIAKLEKIFANDGGASPFQGLRELHKTADVTLGLVRCEKKLTRGITRCEELEDELQNVTISSKSMIYNRELLGALSLENLLTCTRVALKMARERKESRGLHIREDYPMIDNESWQARILAKCRNGADELSKKVPIVTRIPLKEPLKCDYESFILEEELGMKNMEAK